MSIRWAGAALLLSTLLGCRGDTPEPPPMKCIMVVNVSHPDLLDGSLAALRKAGVTAEFRSLADLPPEEVPEWASGEEEGWLLYVREDQADQAVAAYDAWQEERGLRPAEGEERPAPEPVVLGAWVELPPERVEAVRAELARRHEIDQAVRRDPARHGEMAEVGADNTKYLRKLVTEVGWIDVGRFGRQAADTAFLIVQHSGDVPLMTAALPLIEMDVMAGHLSGENYAFLYDRLMYMQGGKQRYGTQVIVKPNGDSVVDRLEDPDRVDERRRKIGLGPLADYLEGFGDVKIGR